MDENAYNPSDRINFLATHGEALRYALLCLTTATKPDIKYEALFNKGLSDIEINLTDALRREQKIRKEHNINNISNIETIINLIKNSNEKINNYKTIEEDRAA